MEYGSRFLSGMLPASGLASHKVHNHRWSAFPVEDVAAENALPRSAMGPSTNATYAVARTNAQLARVLRAFDAARADRLWASAQEAWKRAEAAPDVDYTEATPDAEGGGDYADTGNDDDRYAAAAELFLTAQRRAERAEIAEPYRTAVTGSPTTGASPTSAGPMWPRLGHFPCSRSTVTCPPPISRRCAGACGRTATR